MVLQEGHQQQTSERELLINTGIKHYLQMVISLLPILSIITLSMLKPNREDYTELI